MALRGELNLAYSGRLGALGKGRASMGAEQMAWLS